jgi:hypothetical protein
VNEFPKILDKADYYDDNGASQADEECGFKQPYKE